MARSLMDVVAEVPDHRQDQGKRYSLGSVLTLACVATLCGYRSYGAMADWGRNYGAALVGALGFTRGCTPCAATFSLVFRGINRVALERAVNGWAEEILAERSPQGRGGQGYAIDGKTLRGSKKQGAVGTHLLSMVSHALGLTIFTQAVEEKTNEITAIQEVLTAVVLTGRVITVDALLTQRAVATTIVAGAGDYVMMAKDNQPGLCADIHAVLATPTTLGEPIRTAHTTTHGRGRHERRCLHVRTLLPGDTDWPAAAQVFRLDRRVVSSKTGEIRQESVLGVTSLSQEQADPSTLLHLIRGHWTIENRSHYIRDVTFDEDRSQVRVGATPQTMATLRNLAIGLIRSAGHPNVAAACRHFAARPIEALALAGIPLPEN